MTTAFAACSVSTSPWRGEVGLRSRPGGGEPKQPFMFSPHPGAFAPTLPLQGRVIGLVAP